MLLEGTIATDSLAAIPTRRCTLWTWPIGGVWLILVTTETLGVYMKYSIFQHNFPTSFTKYRRFSPEIITGRYMVIFLIPLTHISIWSLKKNPYSPLIFSATDSWLMGTICAVNICISLILNNAENCYILLKTSLFLSLSSAEALSQGLGYTGYACYHLAPHSA